MNSGWWKPIITSTLIKIIVMTTYIACCQVCTLPMLLILAPFPDHPRFSSSACIQYNTQKQKSGKNGSYAEHKTEGQKWGRAGNEAISKLSTLQFVT